jgi:hypothetical protein
MARIEFVVKTSLKPGPAVGRSDLMIFDLAKILQSKHAFRKRVAALPIEEKLALLDALRERALLIRPAHSTPKPGQLNDEPVPYQVEVKKLK